MLNTDAQLPVYHRRLDPTVGTMATAIRENLRITAIPTATCLTMDSPLPWAIPIQNPGQMCLSVWVWVTCLYPSCTGGWERVCVIFRFFFFSLYPLHVEVPGPGLDPCHSSNLSCCCDNTGSLTHRVTRKLGFLGERQSQLLISIQKVVISQHKKKIYMLGSQKITNIHCISVCFQNTETLLSWIPFTLS